MKLAKGKKGVEAETLMQAFGIIIAALVVLLLIHVGNSIWKVFSNEQDQGTRESFKLLGEKIQKLKDGEKTEQLYYIKPDFALYGFNLEQKTYYNRPIQLENAPVIGGIVKTPSVNKPKACNGRPCICICDNADCSGRIKDCKIFNEIDYYVAENLQRTQGTEINFRDSSGKDIKARYLAVFGKRAGIGPVSDEFGARPIAIRREANAIYFSDGKSI